MGHPAFVVPALRKVREERGTQFIFCAAIYKAGPPVPPASRKRSETWGTQLILSAAYFA
jgi:hypothetical protein